MTSQSQCHGQLPEDCAVGARKPSRRKKVERIKKEKERERDGERRRR